MKHLTQILTLILTFVLGVNFQANAQWDVTSKYLENADFSLTTPINADIRTDPKDIVGTDVQGLQEVNGWTIAEGGSNKAGAVFSYGSAHMLRGNSKNPPATGPEGNVGNCLGILAVWGTTSQYYQNVTLQAGSYRFNTSVYNAGGTQAFATNLIGFIPDTGTPIVYNEVPAVGEWTHITLDFTITETTTGKISLGYQSGGSGSGANPHLFFDNVQIFTTSLYLYNEEGNGWLREGNAWGTQSSLMPYGGSLLNLTQVGDNQYKIMVPAYGNTKGLGENLYLDNATPATWTVEKQTDGTYTFKNTTAGGYLAIAETQPQGKPLVTIGSISARSKWRVVSRAERIESLDDATTDHPMDATFFIQNPDFSRGFIAGQFGWSGPDNTVATGTGANSNNDAEYPNHVQEFYNTNFDNNQTLTGLPQGTYRIKMQGFYRPGENGSDDGAQNAILYAGEQNTPVQIIGTTSIPNSRKTAGQAFTDGRYDDNILDFTVGSSSTITIGVRKNVLISNDWTTMDNFRLTYYGSCATAADWTRLETALNSHTWGFENGEYAPYNNVAAAVSWSNAKAFYDAHTHDGSEMVRVNELNAHIANINNATWTANVGEVNAFCWDYSRYTDNTDNQTPLGFTGGNGGTIRISANYSTNTGLNNLNPKMVLNLLAGSLYGETTGYNMPLKASTSYELTFKYGGWGGNSGNPTITVTDPSGTTVISRALTSVPASEGANNRSSVTIYFNTTTAGDYKVSFPYATARTAFGELKIVRLTTVGDVPTQVAGNLMRKEVYDEQNAAYAAWNGAGGHTPVNYVRVLNAHEEAVKSHECYVVAHEAVTKADFMLNHTNVYTVEAYTTFMNLYEPQRELFEERIMEDVEARNLLKTIFGTGAHHQTGVPVVPFLSSAWDNNGGYDWTTYHVNTWSVEGDIPDYTTGYMGTYPQNYPTPFMEYWVADNQTLANKTMTATVPAAQSTAYTVTANVRIRTNDGNAPTGISMKVGNGNAVTISTGGTKDGNYYFFKPVTASGQPNNGQLTIQFIVSGTSNVSWLCFRDVWVDYTTAGDIADWTAVKAAIDEGNGKTLGFWGTEYAPYTNAEKLQVLEELNEYYTTRSSNPNPVLVSTALNTYNSITWNQNPGLNYNPANEDEGTEMNAVFWDYRNSKAEDFIINKEDGTTETKPGIIPLGWDLFGRADAYHTRLLKYNVSTYASDRGIFATDDSTALFTKFDTRYGEKLGYTMPLKPGLKYSLTFIYTNWANEAINEADQFHDNLTYITIRKKNDPSYKCNIYLTDDDDNDGNDVRLEYISQDVDQDIDYGNNYTTKWKAVRAHFTTAPGSGNEEYVIEIDKSVKKRQIQTVIGELYILKYRNNVITFDGQNQNIGTAPNYTDNYKLDTRLRAGNIKLTRTFKKGQWNSLCLPFKLPYRDMRQIIRKDGQPAFDKVYAYTGTTRKGIYEVLNFTSRQTGIQAGQPLLVQPYNDVEHIDVSGDVIINQVILKNYVVKNTEPIQRDPNNIYDFVGVYEVYNVQPYDVYTKYNATTQKDELIKKVTDDKKTWLQPTRAFFRDVTVDRGGHSVKGEVQLFGFNLDDVETGIIAVGPDGSMTVTSGNIYDLNGRLVRQNATNLEGLSPGIYVVDGRKVMVR